MTQDRQCVLGVLLVAGVGLAAWPVAAAGQGPANEVLGGAPQPSDVVGQVEQKLAGVRPPAAAPDAGSAPARQVPVAPAAPRPAAPTRAGGSSGSQAAPSKTGYGAGGRVSRAGASAGSADARAAASGSDGSSAPAAKAADAGSGRSSHSASAVQSVRPAATSPGSQVQNRADMPFTGFDVFRLAGIGLVALGAGLAIRLGLRRRSLT